MPFQIDFVFHLELKLSDVDIVGIGIVPSQEGLLVAFFSERSTLCYLEYYVLVQALKHALEALPCEFVLYSD